MTLKGKGMNLQVLTECVCYLIFGGLLFYLTSSGGYLNYVTPRMKPYLYGMSFLMFLWAAVSGRYILTPQYRIRLARSFVFIIPILLLAFRPAPSESSMVGAYQNSNIAAAAGNGGGQMAGGSGQQPPPGGQVPLPSSAGSETESSASDSGQETTAARDSGSQADTTSQSGGDGNAWYTLSGLDTAAKTITISDDDYYTWMYELSSAYEKYIGYTVVIKGFIYRDSDILKKGDFALVRLSMWCCSADLTPMGFIVKSDKKVDFKDDDWVTVKGKLGISADGNSITLEAQSIQAAEKPKQEYIYPYF